MRSRRKPTERFPRRSKQESIYLRQPKQRMEPTAATNGELVAVRGAGVPLRAAHHERVRERIERVDALMDAGVTVNRPPRDGRMAFVRSPDNISIELLQRGDALDPAEPWASMENIGRW